MKKLTLFMLLCLAAINSNAQELENILLASRDDANKITEAYISPAMKGLIYGMNSGWYHTAKVHKKLGFDVTIGFNASMVPSEDEIMTFANLGLSNNITFSSPTSPTVAGSGDGAQASITQTYNGQSISAELLALPDGISEDLPLNAVPTPSIQLSVGLPYKFDVMLRVVPEVGDDDVKGKLFGVGLKKEITSILGPLDKLPLHVSLLAAYTSMNVNYAMDQNTFSGQNQNAEFKLNSFTAQAIASLNFPIINVYGGIGYTGGNSTLKMLGTYQLEYTAGSNSITEEIVDPIDLDFDAGGMRATLGVRLSLGFFKLFADYTLQEYNTLSAGMAFSFR
ncbi:hypothetical protein Q4Q39_01485 [Flavivirga amylovorans]|uniref:PorT family protein n=1 Tax=Flavivirga amylovorans TaxID=870486 RepID=A0ABT8WXF4_9FLAO|nr:DUF6588 family protein [Flavivirga amylovorans]MDO5986064.1 hypothetical protein [Flavivirga amylovorans]